MAHGTLQRDTPSPSIEKRNVPKHNLQEIPVIASCTQSPNFMQCIVYQDFFYQPGRPYWCSQVFPWKNFYPEAGLLSCSHHNSNMCLKLGSNYAINQVHMCLKSCFPSSGCSTKRSSQYTSMHAILTFPPRPLTLQTVPYTQKGFLGTKKHTIKATESSREQFWNLKSSSYENK